VFRHCAKHFNAFFQYAPKNFDNKPHRIVFRHAFQHGCKKDTIGPPAFIAIDARLPHADQFAITQQQSLLLFFAASKNCSVALLG
jgi:hypothetical protein